jgi:cell division protein FtsX
MMKKVFAFLAVLVVCVVGFGFYSSWWTLSSTRPDADSNKVDINLSVNPDKVKEDAAMVKDKAAELTGQDENEANELDDPATANVKSDDE